MTHPPPARRRGEADDEGHRAGEAIREGLVRLARRILELEKEGRLLDSPADLQLVLGDLRHRLFEFEVRGATRIREEREKEKELAREGERLVKEARAGEEALRRSLEPPNPEEEDHG